MKEKNRTTTNPISESEIKRLLDLIHTQKR